MQGILTFLVQLDPRLQTLIAFLVTGAVSYAILYLASFSPALAAFLGQYKAGIVTFFTGLIVNLIQNILNNIPERWDTVAALVMTLIVEVAVVLFGFSLLRKRGAKALQ